MPASSPGPRLRMRCAVWSLIGGAAAMLVLLGSGCNTPGRPAPGRAGGAPTLSQADRMTLQNRALDLLLQAAEHDDPVVACNAIESLVRVAPRDGLPAFRRALHSEMPLVRYAGFVALGQLRDKASLAEITAGVNDAHPNVRLAAAFAAYRNGKTGYARVLVQALSDGPDEGLRAEAAGLIGRLDEPAAKRWLRHVLRTSPGSKATRVSLAINGALARLGDEEALGQLVLHARGDTVARTEALLIISELDLPAASEELLYALVGPEEEYLEARLIAARGLGKLGHREGYDLAARMVTYTDPNPNPTAEKPDRTFPVRSLAIHALAEMRDARALDLLCTAAADPEDPRLQVAAAYAICRILGR